MVCPTCKAIAAVLDAAGVPKGAAKSIGKYAGDKIEKPVKRRAKSAWNKYVKNPKNQIKWKTGAKKGLLNLKAMARAYKKKRR